MVKTMAKLRIATPPRVAHAKLPGPKLNIAKYLVFSSTIINIQEKHWGEGFVILDKIKNQSVDDGNNHVRSIFKLILRIYL